MTGYKGVKTDEALEQEMFSLLNMIIKRGFYQSEESDLHKSTLKQLCVEYLMDYDKRPTY